MKQIVGSNEKMIKKFISDLKHEFKGYSPASLRQDFFAGITVTAVALPLALAFGVSSGATASAGLITAIIAGVVIGAFAGGSFQISGPTGAMAAILTALIQKYGLEGIWIAGLLSGIFLVVAGLLRFGRLVSLIPAPVVTGFTSGIALMIIIGQIDHFLGVTTAPQESAALKLIHYFGQPLSPNWYAVGSGLMVVAIMLLWPKKWSAVFPASLAALIIVVGASILFHFPVEVIGDIPKTLLPEQRLSFGNIDLSSLRGMLVPAVSIAVLGMIESLLCGEVASRMKEEKYDANRDLISQGIGNIVIPFFGGVPATAAIARTSVAIKSGGKTRLVSIFHAIGLLLSMFLLAPVMSQIPVSALAGILFVTAWRMNEWHSIKYLFSHKFKGAMGKFLITMVATVIFDLTQAILIGVVFALVLFVVKISDMQITIQEVDTKRLIGKLDSSQSAVSHIRVAYFTGPLFFATIGQLREQLMDSEQTGVLILSMRGVSHIDMSGIVAVNDLYDQLKKNGCKMMICSLQPKVEAMLRRGSVIEKIGEDCLFWSADQAILAASGGVDRRVPVEDTIPG
jgi:SulP family sulfate permease